MLFFLVSCLSFLVFSQSFLKPNQTSKIDDSRMWDLLFIFWERLFLVTKRKIFTTIFQVPKIAFPSIKRFLSARFDFVEKVVNEDKEDQFSLLDLPDLPLDSILEKLSPAELCSMAAVCASLRERCKSDHLWERHMQQKWGGLIGHAACTQYLQSQIAFKRAPKSQHCSSRTSKMLRFFSGLMDFFRYKKSEKIVNRSCKSPVNSVMSCYMALETGKFWFPAQVFNRENGHVGFMLSCYDAQLSYGSTTDNFIARYRAQGRNMIEEGIEWNRIRAPTVETPSNVLHISECLDELKPGDHVEIQWRRNKDFPYGWWYGVVGHVETCNGNEFNCLCHINDRVILEFKQYSPESRWRKTMISRRDHTEIGNEGDGFYGGIRRLCNKDEIAKWKKLWPNCTLE